MLLRNLYHGTTMRRADTIRNNGFRTGERRLDRWLASNGVYLVASRPTVAYHFAERTARSDRAVGPRDTPVVLSVSLSWPIPEKILDLTTDQGLWSLYDTCEQVYGYFRAPKPGDELDAEYASMKASAREDMQDVDEMLCNAKKKEEQGGKVNWTTVSIDLLVMLCGYSVVLAIFQEGRTFHQVFGTRMPKVSTVPEYEGIRIRDHIEVCVIDQSLIDASKIVLVEIEELRLDDPFVRMTVVTG